MNVFKFSFSFIEIAVKYIFLSLNENHFVAVVEWHQNVTLFVSFFNRNACFNTLAQANHWAKHYESAKGYTPKYNVSSYELKINWVLSLNAFISEINFHSDETLAQPLFWESPIYVCSTVFVLKRQLNITLCTKMKSMLWLWSGNLWGFFHLLQVGKWTLSYQDIP